MRILKLVCVCILLMGCDHFPGPNIRSEFPSTVNVIVSYSDGKTFSHEWASCNIFSLGAIAIGKWGIKPKDDVSIDLIIIEQGDKTVLQFDKKMIDKLIENEGKQKGHYIWVVDDSGMNLSNETECSISQNS